MPDVIEFNPIYSFIRARILEGTFPGTTPQTGHGAVTGNRVLRMYGAMPMSVWPATGNPWPPTLPDRAMEFQARLHRIGSYHRIIDLEAARFALAHANTFSTVVPITAQWMKADRGRIETPKSWGETTDRHSVAIMGYDDEARHLIFLNSWGKDWGDGGVGYLPYDYWTSFNLDSWIIHGLYESLHFWPHPRRYWGSVEFAWTRFISGVGFRSGVELWTEDGSMDLGWAFAVEDRTYLNVHELFIRPEYRRRGYGRFLVKRLEQVAHGCGLIPQFWLSHIDNAELGQNKLDIAYNLGYRVEESGVTWAAKLIVPKTQPRVDRPQSQALQYGSCAAASVGLTALRGQATHQRWPVPDI